MITNRCLWKRVCSVPADMKTSNVTYLCSGACSDYAHGMAALLKTCCFCLPEIAFADTPGPCVSKLLVRI